jgi:hypothetical protein
MTLMTNDTGYYEANLLISGNYRLTLEKAGFRKLIRSGVDVPINARAEINLSLELGEVADGVSITEEAPLVDTSSAASAGRIMTPGSCRSCRHSTTAHSCSSSWRRASRLTIIAGATVSMRLEVPTRRHNVGAVAGNDWSIDGVPGMGNGYRPPICHIRLQLPRENPNSHLDTPKSSRHAHSTSIALMHA